MAIPVHRSAEADPYERGLAFGRAQAAAVDNTVATYAHLFRVGPGLTRRELARLAAGVGETLERDHPELRRELAGIADGAGQAETDLLAINARTELLAGSGPPECSVLALRDPAGRTVLAQNWDFHPLLARSLVVWVIAFPDDRWLATMTEAGMLAKIGINHRGLGVCLNLLGSSADGGEPRTPVHVLLRLVLERCRDVAEAVALLEGAEVSASSALTLAAPGQRTATVELSPGGNRTLLAGDEVHGHTNHFLHDPPVGCDTTVDEWPDTVARLETLRESGADSVHAVLASHAGHPYSVCRHDDPALADADRSITLASIVMELDGPRLEVALGAPCEAPYTAIELPALTRSAS